jgi:hypothetical protein
MTGNQHIWWDIPIYSGHATDESVSANPDKLVDGTQASQDGMILDNHMSCQSGGICHDHVIADNAVMSNVTVGHKKTVVADSGHPFILANTASIDGDKLPYYIIVTNYGFSAAAVEF